MAPVSSSRWGHWLASLALFVVYLPSNLVTPFLILDLFEHRAELMSPRFVLGALISCAFVNAGLLLAILGARRLKPAMLMALRVLLLVYALPHMLLIGVLAPMSTPGAWIP